MVLFVFRQRKKAALELVFSTRSSSHFSPLLCVLEIFNIEVKRKDKLTYGSFLWQFMARFCFNSSLGCKGCWSLPQPEHPLNTLRNWCQYGSWAIPSQPTCEGPGLNPISQPHFPFFCLPVWKNQASVPLWLSFQIADCSFNEMNTERRACSSVYNCEGWVTGIFLLCFPHTEEQNSIVHHKRPGEIMKNKRTEGA